MSAGVGLAARIWTLAMCAAIVATVGGCKFFSVRGDLGPSYSKRQGLRGHVAGGVGLAARNHTGRIAVNEIAAVRLAGPTFDDSYYVTGYLTELEANYFLTSHSTGSLERNAACDDCQSGIHLTLRGAAGPIHGRGEWMGEVGLGIGLWSSLRGRDFAWKTDFDFFSSLSLELSAVRLRFPDREEWSGLLRLQVTLPANIPAFIFLGRRDR